MAAFNGLPPFSVFCITSGVVLGGIEISTFGGLIYLGLSSDNFAVVVYVDGSFRNEELSLLIEGTVIFGRTRLLSLSDGAAGAKNVDF